MERRPLERWQGRGNPSNLRRRKLRLGADQTIIHTSRRTGREPVRLGGTSRLGLPTKSALQQRSGVSLSQRSLRRYWSLGCCLRADRPTAGKVGGQRPCFAHDVYGPLAFGDQRAAPVETSPYRHALIVRPIRWPARSSLETRARYRSPGCDRGPCRNSARRRSLLPTSSGGQHRPGGRRTCSRRW